MIKYISFALIIISLLYQIQETSAIDPVFLHLDNEEFVNLLIGNPGSVLTLRVTFQCDYTVKLFSYPNSFSLTHVKYPYENMTGNIIVYLGHKPYRFHVIFDPMARSISEPEYDYTYHGILCLAKESQLWLHWQRFTLSPRGLFLGSFSNHMSRNYPYPYTINLKEVNIIVPYLNDEEVEHDKLFFKFDPSIRHTILPSRYYHHLCNFSFGIEPYGHEARMIIEEVDKKRSLPNGFDEWLISTDPSNHTHFIMGTYILMRSFTLYVDWVTENFVIRPSHDHLFPLLREHRFASAFALLTMFVLFFWVTDHDSHLLYFSIKEFYSITFSAIAVTLFLAILHYERYITFMMHSNHHFWIYAGSFFVLFLFELLFAFIFYNSSKNMNARFTLVESLLCLTIWLMLLPCRGNALEQLAFLFVNAYYPVSSLFTLITSRVNIEIVLTVFIALFSNFFYIYFTLIPIIRFNWFDFPKLAISVIIMWSSIVGIILMTLHSEFIISRLQEIAQKTKEEKQQDKKERDESGTTYQQARNQSLPSEYSSRSSSSSKSSIRKDLREIEFDLD